MPRKETATAPKASVASTQVMERGDSCGAPPWWPWSSCAVAASRPWAAWAACAAAGAAWPWAAWSSWPWAAAGAWWAAGAWCGAAWRRVRVLAVLLGVTLRRPGSRR